MDYDRSFSLATLVIAGLALAACNQQAPPQVQTPKGTSASVAQNALSTSPLSGTPSPATLGLRTAQEATSQLKDVDLTLLVTSAAPGWTAGLLDAQNRLKGGALHAGVPIALTSPIELEIKTNSSVAEDVAALPGLKADLSSFGDAALVPLLLENGAVAGLARLPLYLGTETTYASLEYVLFTQPVKNLMTAQEAGTAAGQPGARVIAVALGSNGAYDPFDFHWLVEAAGTQATPTLVAPGLPPLLTQRGETVTPTVSSVSRLNIASVHLSVKQAAEAYTIYESVAQTTQRLNLSGTSNLGGGK